MIVRTTDFNDAGTVIAQHLAAEYAELEAVLAATPLNLKASDQAGKQGSPIFDPVGTNAAIATALVDRQWTAKHPIPAEFSFLGTDVDFVKNGLLAEVQFSNYPFLLNNLLRSELFFKAKTPLAGHSVRAVVIVAKAFMFDASNSTLYYEQALSQLSALAQNRVFNSPMRLVGLFETTNGPFVARFNEYHNPRYSRTVIRSVLRNAMARPGRSAESRVRIELGDVVQSI
ncbi:MAG: hypothetical protein K2X32_04560 [Phycisphaerales bacterium]|nr:hypothetical protein [Phycisphaerales bacterium]